MHSVFPLRAGVSLAAVAATTLFAGQSASAQTAPTNIVSACSGVSLPRSVVTDIVSPVVTGIVNPVQGTVNPILGVVGGALPLVPPLNIDAAGLLANAAAGNPITLQAVNVNGTVVGPADRCDLQADSYTLRTPQGISIGGNRITGLGTTGQEATAGEASSIAFGNTATTDATAVGAVAIGAQSSVGPAATGAVALGAGASATGVNGVALGAGSIAARAPMANYTVIGLPGAQTSAGEVSVGAPGAERQITNVAAGSAATDAVNVGQLAGVQAQIGAATANAVLYDTATHDRVTLSGAAGTVLSNVAPGAVAAGSTEAVNGSQLFATNTAVTNATTALTTLTTNVTNGAVGPVQYASAATPTIPNGGVPSNDVTLVGATAAPVGLHNVAGGVVAVGSTDAVNGGQLAGLGQSVAAGLGGASRYDPTTGSIVTSLAVGGTQYGSVQSALDALNGTVAASASSRYFQVNSTRAAATATGADSVAIGPEATVSAGNSVALGTGSTATRGASTGYTALGVTGTQNSAGEVSIGAVGAERQLTNVAAGTAATDAANVGQVAGVAAQVAALGDSAVQYDGGTKTSITLAGAGGTTITNVAAGTLAPGSSDAVNGAQLYATNTQVANNTTAITNLGNQIASSGSAPVQYSNAAAPNTPNGGTKTNDVTLVGAATGPVALHNVATGSVAAGSTDAVNGGQLATTNQAVATAQGTANTALTLGNNSVQYGPSRTNVTFNAGGTATVLSNVAAGTSTTDAANVGQLNAGINSAVTQSNAYTDGRIAALNFDLRAVRRDSFAGTSSALAAAGLPQAYEAGKGMIALGGGTYAGQSAVAFGASKAFNDGHTVMKLSGTYDTQGRAGASGGIGYQF